MEIWTLTMQKKRKAGLTFQNEWAEFCRALSEEKKIKKATILSLDTET